MTRRQPTAAGLLAQAEVKGSTRGAYKEQDRVKDERRHNEKTKQNHNATLNRYILWRLARLERDRAARDLPVPTEQEVRAQYLARGAELPDFYIHTSQPKLASSTTTDSMGTITEWFFADFTRLTGTVVPAETRSGVYGWLRKVLTAEDVLVNKRRPKHNFTATDLTRMLVTAWTKDDLIFTPQYRIQFTLLIASSAGQEPE